MTLASQRSIQLESNAPRLGGTLECHGNRLTHANER